MRYPYTDRRTGVTYLGGTETPGVTRYRMQHRRRSARWLLGCSAAVLAVAVWGLAVGHLHGVSARLRVADIVGASIGAVGALVALWRYRKARWPR